MLRFAPKKSSSRKGPRRKGPRWKAPLEGQEQAAHRALTDFARFCLSCHCRAATKTEGGLGQEATFKVD